MSAHLWTMKKLLGCGMAGLLVLGLLGYLFVSWANRPENVQALKEHRVQEAAAAEAAAKRKAELVAETATKRKSLKLVFEETFTSSALVGLDSSQFKEGGLFEVKDKALKFNHTVTRGEGSYAYRILSNEEFEDFVAELDMGIWGDHGYAGITWVAGKDEDGHAIFQQAYSSPSYLYVKTDDEEHFGLGSFLTAENNQKIRVEKLAESLRVSVNGKILFDEMLPAVTRGKVGLYFGTRGGSDSTTSVSVSDKSFKVWRP